MNIFIDRYDRLIILKITTILSCICYSLMFGTIYLNQPYVLMVLRILTGTTAGLFAGVNVV